MMKWTVDGGRAVAGPGCRFVINPARHSRLVAWPPASCVPASLCRQRAGPRTHPPHSSHAAADFESTGTRGPAVPAAGFRPCGGNRRGSGHDIDPAPPLRRSHRPRSNRAASSRPPGLTPVVESNRRVTTGAKGSPCKPGKILPEVCIKGVVEAAPSSRQWAAIGVTGISRRRSGGRRRGARSRHPRSRATRDRPDRW